VSPGIPQVASDSVNRNEVDRVRSLGWTLVLVVIAWPDKLESAFSVRFDLVILQPSPARISRVTNEPQAAGRVESYEGTLTVVVDANEDGTGLL
jgi:hypothetical protein